MSFIWKKYKHDFSRRIQKKKFEKVEKFFFVKEAFSKTGFLCKSKNNGRWGGGRVWRRHFSSDWNAPDLCPCEIPSQHFYFSMLTWWRNQSPKSKKRKCSTKISYNFEKSSMRSLKKHHVLISLLIAHCLRINGKCHFKIGKVNYDGCLKLFIWKWL